MTGALRAMVLKDRALQRIPFAEPAWILSLLPQARVIRVPLNSWAQSLGLCGLAKTDISATPITGIRAALASLARDLQATGGATWVEVSHPVSSWIGRISGEFSMGDGLLLQAPPERPGQLIVAGINARRKTVSLAPGLAVWDLERLDSMADCQLGKDLAESLAGGISMRKAAGLEKSAALDGGALHHALSIFLRTQVAFWVALLVRDGARLGVPACPCVNFSGDRAPC